jgi:hypothetical protein
LPLFMMSTFRLKYGLFPLYCERVFTTKTPEFAEGVAAIEPVAV